AHSLLHLTHSTANNFSILNSVCSFPTGLIDGSDVTQNETLWKFKGDNATIDCRQTKGATFYYMYWYRQLPGETIKQIVFTSSINTDHDFGNFSTVKFSATKPDAASGTFTVKNLEPEDKGLYFCAVSKHSDTDALNS
uniref:Ig-like domain-containing protein n=1 Tax=Dicentrarchus labrax TaxID=13489 RepID=A0A8C4DQI8_DICLA